MRRWHYVLIGLVMTFCVRAQSEQPAVPNTTLRGFATLGAVYLGEDGVAFRRSINQPSGATGGELDFGVDSRIGLQLNQRLGKAAELVLQLASENDARGWQPQVTRAFVRLRLPWNLSLRLGRLPYEFHSGPISRYAGYSSLMLRQPSELFGTLPNNQFDGMDLSLTVEQAASITRLRGYAGETYGTIVTLDGLHRDISGSRMYGLSIETVTGDWTFRASGLRVELSTPSSMPMQPSDGDNTDWTAQPSPPQQKLSTLSLGVLYEHGPLQSQLCFTHFEASRNFNPPMNVGVLLVGYRFGALTPYTSYSLISSGSSDFQAPGNTSGSVVDGTEQQTIALGLRYDLRPRYALKFQIDRLHLGNHHLMLDTDPLTRDPKQMMVYSVALDLVF